MKKLTLNEAWNRCLAMWKWIDKQIEKGPDLDVEELKEKWLRTKQKKYDVYDLISDCFFCEYDAQQDDSCNCSFCPGKLISKSFKCIHTEYNYEYQPRKFYKKLLQLNEERLKGKKNGKLHRS